MNPRILTVEERGTAYRIAARTPMIRLKGRWLQRAGFNSGAKVSVTQTQAGVLEIRVCSAVQVTADSLEIMGRITEACVHADERKAA